MTTDRQGITDEEQIANFAGLYGRDIDLGANSQLEQIAKAGAKAMFELGQCEEHSFCYFRRRDAISKFRHDVPLPELYHEADELTDAVYEAIDAELIAFTRAYIRDRLPAKVPNKCTVQKWLANKERTLKQSADGHIAYWNAKLNSGQAS